MFRTVSAALVMPVRTASSTLVWLLPTISLSRYTWLVTLVPPRPGSVRRPWHSRAPSAHGRCRRLPRTYVATATYVLLVAPNTPTDGCSDPPPDRRLRP